METVHPAHPAPVRRDPNAPAFLDRMQGNSTIITDENISQKDRIHYIQPELQSNQLILHFTSLAIDLSFEITAMLNSLLVPYSTLPYEVTQFLY